MKKIIKPGADRFVITCSRCGCEYCYEVEDIGRSSNLILTTPSVECPKCGNIDVHVKENATF